MDKTPRFEIKDDRLAFAGYKFESDGGNNAVTQQKAMVDTRDDVSNIRVRLVDETLIVTYDLLVKADINAYVSLDGGVTWHGPLKHVTGAVGKGVSEGKDKIFVWEAAKEIGYVDVNAAIIKLESVAVDDVQEAVVDKPDGVGKGNEGKTRDGFGRFSLVVSGGGLLATENAGLVGGGGKFRVGWPRVRVEGGFSCFPLDLDNLYGAYIWDVSLNMHLSISKKERFVFYTLFGGSYVFDEFSGISAVNIGAGFDVKLFEHLYFNLEGKGMYFIPNGIGVFVSPEVVLRF
jgi:hypothetical protein